MSDPLARLLEDCRAATQRLEALPPQPAGTDPLLRGNLVELGRHVGYGGGEIARLLAGIKAGVRRQALPEIEEAFVAFMGEGAWDALVPYPPRGDGERYELVILRGFDLANDFSGRLDALKAAIAEYHATPATKGDTDPKPVLNETEDRIARCIDSHTDGIQNEPIAKELSKTGDRVEPQTVRRYLTHDSKLYSLGYRNLPQRGYVPPHSPHLK